MEESRSLTYSINVRADTAQAESNLLRLVSGAGNLEHQAGGIGSAFRKSFLAGIDSGNSFGSSIRSGMGGAFDFAISKAEDFREDVVESAQDIKNGFAHPIDTIKNGLGSAIQGAKDKFIDMARGAEEAADGAEDVGSASDNAAKDVRDLGNAADSSGGKFEKFGSVLKGIGVALAASTTAITAFAASSVNVGMEFDSSMSQVAATMGYSVEEINTIGSEANQTYSELREFAMEMGASTAFSATQAADALNYMALAGYDSEKSMSMLPNVLNLAAAGGMELAAASDMVTDAQSALGLTMDETTEMVDKMAKASSKSNTSVAQLGSAILTVGGTAKNLAGGTTELSTALGILADNGVKGAEGGTALRNIILSLSAPTDKAAQMLADMGVAVYDADGNMRPLNESFGELNAALSTMTQGEQTQALTEIFNKADLKSVNALLSGTAANLDDVGAALEASGVDWIKYADKAWASVDGMSESLIEDIKYNLGELGTSAEELQEYLQFEYGLDADDAMAVVKSMGTRWDELTGYIDDAAGAAEDMANTQLDNLAGDITLFQSALEGAQIVLSDQLSPTLREFTRFGTDAISTLSAAFQEGGLSGAMGALGTILSDAVSMIIETLPTVIDAGMQLLGALGQGILSNLPTLIGAAAQIVVTLASGIGTALPELIPSVAETLLLVVSTLIENLPLVLDAGMQILGGLSDGIMTALPMLVEQLPEIILQIVGFLSDNLPTILEQGSQMLLSLGMGIIDAVPQLVAQLPAIISSIVGFITENRPLIIETGVNLVVQLGVGLIQAIPQLAAQLPQIISAIVGGFAEVPGMMLDIGKNIVKGVWDGISAMGSWIKEKVSGFFGGIVDGVKGVLGIHSPSTVFADIGDNMAQGLGKGFGESMEGVSENIQNAIPADIEMPVLEVGIPDISALSDIGTALKASGVDWEKYRDKVRASADGMFDGLVKDIRHNISELGMSAEEFQEYLRFEYDLDAEDAMAVITSVGNGWRKMTGNMDNAAVTVHDTPIFQNDIRSFGNTTPLFQNDNVSYSISPIAEEADVPAVKDISYAVRPEYQNANPPAIPDMRYGIKPVVEDANLSPLPNIGYSVKPTVESANIPQIPDMSYNVRALVEGFEMPNAVTDMTYGVNPVIRDIKTPDVPDVFYGVNPVVEGFTQPKLTDISYNVRPNVEGFSIPNIDEDAAYNVRPVMGAVNVPKIDDYDLSGSMNYSINPVMGDMDMPQISDISYGVRPIVESVNPPVVDDVLYGIHPVIEDFNPPDVSAAADYGAVVPANTDSSGTAGGGGDNSSGAVPAFAPIITIPVTVQGSVDEQTIENMRDALRNTFYDVAKELFEEFRSQELEHMALKEQYAF